MEGCSAKGRTLGSRRIEAQLGFPAWRQTDGRQWGEVADARLSAIEAQLGSGGTNMVTNGDFSSGSTGWIVSSGSVTGGHYVVTGGSNMLYQNVGFVTGTTYTVTFTYTCTAGSKLRITNSNLSDTNVVSTQSVTVDGATHTFTATFTALGPWLGIEADSATFSGTIDNIVAHA